LQSEQYFRVEGGLGDRVDLRAVAQLRPHPALIRHHISPSVYKIEALIKLQHVSSCPPLLITRDGLIIDGYARWDLARRQGCPVLPCVSLDVSEEEALEHLLHNEVRHNGMNAYLRIELALELEPWLRKKGSVKRLLAGPAKGLGRSLLQIAGDVNDGASLDFDLGNPVPISMHHELYFTRPRWKLH
jgi:hypothetical protein